MSSLLRDVRHAARVLLRAPGFTLAVVIVLALGIGANTAIFSVVRGVLLRPLPFPDADRLVQIWHVPPPAQFPGMTRFSVSPANYLDWERQNHVFSGMAVYGYASVDVTGGQEPQALAAASVSPGFFPVLGAQPMLGRAFTRDESEPGRDQVVILGNAIWRSQFGGDRGVVGKSVLLDGRPCTVVGVMDASFRFPSWAQAWVPLAWTDQERAVRDNHNYRVLARLGPDATVRGAQAEMDAISAGLQKAYPADDAGWGAVVVPLRDAIVEDVRPALLLLLAAVGLVLLIACANVANLVLARALSRRKEMAIRSALGASRGRVLRQVLTETVLLAVGAGVVGTLLASFGVGFLVRSLATLLPRADEIALDGGVLGFAFLVSLVTGVAAGIAPAWRATRFDLNETLGRGLGRTDAEPSAGRTRGLLVGFEVALSAMLLIGAGLLIRSLGALRAADPGFDPERVLTLALTTSAARYPDVPRTAAFFAEAQRRVGALPGVEAAGVTDDLPLSGGGSTQPVAFEGRPTPPMSEQPEVAVRMITPGYLEAMRIPLVRGRRFEDGDILGRQPVALVSRAMAKRFWPDEDPIGHRLTLHFFPGVVREVVGIVGDVRLDGLEVDEPPAILYVPIDQLTLPPGYVWRGFGASLVVRGSGRPEDLTHSVVAAVRGVDPQLPVTRVQTMPEIVAESLWQRRLDMLLLGSFAGLALILASVGIYSVLAYGVRRRQREIGIRMALGARLDDVLRLVVLDGLRPALVGLACGLAGALALGRLLAGLLYGVGALDPATFASVSALILAAGLLASVWPAWRATRVDPMTVLREE